MTEELEHTKRNENNSQLKTREDVVLIQQFSAACVALLKILQSHVQQKIEKLNEDGKCDKNDREMQAYGRFNESVDRYIASFQDGSFDFRKIMRKIYDTLRSKDTTMLVRSCSASLFELKNEEGKIVSILPGINIRIAYSMLSDIDRIKFWQYFHLMTLSSFNIFYINNSVKVSSQTHVMDMINAIGIGLEKTGIMIDDKIFNPYLGIGSGNGTSPQYGLDELFATTDELHTGEQLGIESMLNTLGLGNLINENELNAKLASLGENDLTLATDQIVKILGASADPNARDVCSKLVRSIVEELKINGVANVGNVLKSVATKSRSEIQINDMKNTMGYVQNFMTDGEAKLKDLKDEHGNPVGEQVMNSISAPMAMMRAMGLKFPPADPAN